MLVEVHAMLHQLRLVPVERTPRGTFQGALVAEAGELVLSQLPGEALEAAPDFFVSARVVHLRAQRHQAVIEGVGQLLLADRARRQLPGAGVAEAVAGSALVDGGGHDLRADWTFQEGEHALVELRLRMDEDDFHEDHGVGGEAEEVGVY